MISPSQRYVIMCSLSIERHISTRRNNGAVNDGIIQVREMSRVGPCPAQAHVNVISLWILNRRAERSISRSSKRIGRQISKESQPSCIHPEHGYRAVLHSPDGVQNGSSPPRTIAISAGRSTRFESAERSTMTSRNPGVSQARWIAQRRWHEHSAFYHFRARQCSSHLGYTLQLPGVERVNSRRGFGAPSSCQQSG